MGISSDGRVRQDSNLRLVKPNPGQAESGSDIYVLRVFLGVYGHARPISGLILSKQSLFNEMPVVMIFLNP